MSQKDLLALRIRQLEKREEDINNAAQILLESRLRSKAQFEKRYETRLSQNSYDPGDLVLIRNSAVEKELDRKTKPRYLGPYEVIGRSQNNAYVLCDLNGAILQHTIAGFRILPYIDRNALSLKLSNK